MSATGVHSMGRLPHFDVRRFQPGEICSGHRCSATDATRAVEVPIRCTQARDEEERPTMSPGRTGKMIVSMKIAASIVQLTR